MLNVYRGVYVDSSLEEFLDILIPFEMAAAFRVGGPIRPLGSTADGVKWRYPGQIREE